LASRKRENLTAYLLISPAALILTVFGLCPILFAAYLSLFKWGLVKERFVGLGNYAAALTSKEFWNAVLVTFFYVAGTVPVSIALGFALACLLFRVVRGRSAYRTVYFLPYVTSTVAAATVWGWIFHSQWGLANYGLTTLGLPAQQWLLEPRGIFTIIGKYAGVVLPSWLGGPSLALVVVMFFAVWHSLGFVIVVFLAGLSNIPRELEDAARIDGASSLQVVRNVTLPLLSPTVFFLAILSVIWSFQAFNHIYVLTEGGPVDTTTNLTMHIFLSFYQLTRRGYGSAVAIILLVLIVGLTAFQARLIGRRVHYR